jgi:hypothetical protein
MVETDNQQKAMDPYENAVFVSYAWGGESERTVDELEQAFAEHGIRIIRDKKDLGYKGSIEAFEQRIGQGQCIVLVISDKYLRSEHCMYELAEVDKNQGLRERIFPVVLADARIYNAIDRLNHIKYWDEQIEKLNQAVKEVNVITNLSGIMADLDKYARIRASFDHLVDLLSDMNTLTPELHASSGYSTLISAVKPAMAEKQPASQSSGVRTQNLDYKYDIFVSYGHESIFDKWLNEIFLQRLKGFLEQLLPRNVQIITAETQSKHDIPPNTKIALAKSRCLVAICCPAYFRSPRCTYEMSVLLQREKRLGFRLEDNTIPLILPVYVFDGEHFPEVISDRKTRCDCNGLTSPSIEYSGRGVDLYEKINGFALEVANSITNAPPWNETFFDDLTPPPAIRESLQPLFERQPLPRL